jgi:hypothetical protein
LLRNSSTSASRVLCPARAVSESTAAASSTPAGSRTGASSHSRAPSPKRGATWAAACSASRVLPTPPGPVSDLRQRGVTIFLTTHRLEEAERLCDRVAILNTTLRTIGRPAELRDQLFARTLSVETLVPLPDPAGVFAGLPAVDGWHHDGPAGYVLAVSDPALAAPAATRALVAAGADVLSISQSRHSLEDVYLELIGQDQEASRR